MSTSEANQEPGDGPDIDAFLRRKARGLAIAARNPIVCEGITQWTDIPRLEDLSDEDRARVERVLDTGHE